MKHKSLDIFIAIAITLIAAGIILLIPANNTLVHLLLLPLVFVLPGYTFMCAMFTRQAFGMPEQVVFSLGLSLIMVILGGLVLNFTPLGLQPISWMILLSGITLIASAVTLVRRRGHIMPTVGWISGGKIGFTFRQGLLLTMAAVMIAGAVAVSIFGAAHQPYPGVTQFWMLRASGATHQTAVHLGVDNMESTAMEYNLKVSVNGKVVKNWPAISLNVHEKWENTLVLSQVTQKGSTKVEAMLYRVDAPTQVYRHVLLWLGS